MDKLIAYYASKGVTTTNYTTEPTDFPQLTPQEEQEVFQKLGVKEEAIKATQVKSAKDLITSTLRSFKQYQQLAEHESDEGEYEEYGTVRIKKQNGQDTIGTLRIKKDVKNGTNIIKIFEEPKSGEEKQDENNASTNTTQEEDGYDCSTFRVVKNAGNDHHTDNNDTQDGSGDDSELDYSTFRITKEKEGKVLKGENSGGPKGSNDGNEVQEDNHASEEGTIVCKLKPQQKILDENIIDSSKFFIYRQPEDWEINIIALERGEWVGGMEEKKDAFRKYKKERPKLGNLFMVAPPNTTAVLKSPRTQSIANKPVKPNEPKLPTATQANSPITNESTNTSPRKLHSNSFHAQTPGSTSPRVSTSPRARDAITDNHSTSDGGITTSLSNPNISITSSSLSADNLVGNTQAFTLGAGGTNKESDDENEEDAGHEEAGHPPPSEEPPLPPNPPLAAAKKKAPGASSSPPPPGSDKKKKKNAKQPPKAIKKGPKKPNLDKKHKRRASLPGMKDASPIAKRTETLGGEPAKPKPKQKKRDKVHAPQYSMVPAYPSMPAFDTPVFQPGTTDEGKAKASPPNNKKVPKKKGKKGGNKVKI